MKVGDPIPEFELPDQDWNTFSSRNLLGKPCVVYFYPKDDTPGCTRQACSFRDQYELFKKAGAEIIGISCDLPEHHRRFKERHGLPFHLLSDIRGELRRKFNVSSLFFGMLPRRKTFVFNAEGRLVHQFSSQTNARKHVDEAIRVLQLLGKRLKQNPRGAKSAFPTS